MKKLLFIFAVLGLTLISCKKDNPAPNSGVGGPNTTTPSGGNPFNDENPEFDDVGDTLNFTLTTNIPITLVDRVVIYSNPHNGGDYNYINDSVTISKDIIDSIFVDFPEGNLTLTRNELTDHGVKFSPLMVGHDSDKLIYNFIGSYMFTIFLSDGDIETYYLQMKNDNNYGLDWTDNNIVLDEDNNTITFTGSF